MNHRRNSGRHFLQIPGPTNVPDRVLNAIQQPTIDHRGPGFRDLTADVLNGLGQVFQTRSKVVVFPSSGTGAWEAALVSTLSAGDRVLMCETGHFARLWCGIAERLGLDPQLLPGDWRHPADPLAIGEALANDVDHLIKAVCVVHNETSTGAMSDVAAVRAVIDEQRHPALLMVDTISSLASIDFRHEEWGVDVTGGGSQKGLMLPPGLGFNAVSDKALAASLNATLPRAYWNWQDMLDANNNGFFPYTPATNLLYGLREALSMLLDEGLENVFERHRRLAEATRCAVATWQLELLCLDSAARSHSLTAVQLPEGVDADAFRATVLARYNMSLGNGLGRLAGRVFRIGHLGDFNELMLIGTLGGVEMGLAASGITHQRGGVTAAMDYLSG